MPGKVLIADDSLKIQKELATLLQEAGVEVATVSNGEHAVRQLPTVKPDLVLADIFMPVRTGYEVCEYIRNSPDFSQTAVLLLVSKMEPFDEKEAERVGANGKIEKPFADPQAVLATIQEHLGKIAAEKPPPPIDEFAEAVPAAGEEEPAGAVPEPEPEPEVFATAPEQVSFDEESTPMGFTDMEETPAEAEAPAEEEEGGFDLGQATMVTSADELRRRIEEERAEAEGPVEEAEVVGEAFLETVQEETPAEASVEAVEAEAEEAMDLSQATMLTSADELKKRIEAERAAQEGTATLEPAEIEEVAEEAAEPAAAEAEEEPEVVPTQEEEWSATETAVIEKPELANAWEMTGPEPGAPEIAPAGGGGWDSQWKVSEGEGEEAGAAVEEAVPAAEAEEAAVEEAPVEEAEAAPAEAAAGGFAPGEFAAAFGGETQVTPAEAEEEAPAPVQEDAEVASELAEQLPGGAAAPVDPALVEEVVNQVLERLSPQVMETIAREIVRPLAEALLREKLRD